MNFTHHPTKIREAGFSIIEMTIVLVLIGTLVSIGIPMLGLLIKQNKETHARQDVAASTKALLGYALAKGGFPDYANDPESGSQLDYQLPHTKLGLKATSQYADILYYDVNDNLRLVDENAEAVGRSREDFCAIVLNEIDRLENIQSSPEPRICNGLGSCDAANPLETSSVAFVVINNGSDRKRQLNNSNDDRVYENPSLRRSDEYDDIVASYSFYTLSNRLGCNDDGIQAVENPDPEDNENDDRDDDNDAGHRKHR